MSKAPDGTAPSDPPGSLKISPYIKFPTKYANLKTEEMRQFNAINFLNKLNLKPQSDIKDIQTTLEVKDRYNSYNSGHHTKFFCNHEKIMISLKTKNCMYFRGNISEKGTIEEEGMVNSIPTEYPQVIKRIQTHSNITVYENGKNLNNARYSEYALKMLKSKSQIQTQGTLLGRAYLNFLCIWMYCFIKCVNVYLKNRGDIYKIPIIPRKPPQLKMMINQRESAQETTTRRNIGDLLPPTDPPPWYRPSGGGGLGGEAADGSVGTVAVAGLRGVKFCLNNLNSCVLTFHNVNSLRNKINELIDVTKRINFTCMAFLDTRIYLKNQIPLIPGYKSFYQLKPNKTGSGGIVVYVKENLESYLLNEPDDLENENILWVGLKLQTRKVAICTTYWRPTTGCLANEAQTRLERHEQMATRIVTTKTILENQDWETIIGGDFNAKMGRNYPGFPENPSAEVNPNGKILRDIILHHDSKNFFNWRWGGASTTYYCQGTGRTQRNQGLGTYSVLDNVLWSVDLPVDFCFNSEPGDEIDIGSDHSWLTVTINDRPVNKRRTAEKYIWRLRNPNWRNYQITQARNLESPEYESLSYDLAKKLIRQPALSCFGKSKVRLNKTIVDDQIRTWHSQLKKLRKDINKLQLKKRLQRRLAQTDEVIQEKNVDKAIAYVNKCVNEKQK